MKYVYLFLLLLSGILVTPKNAQAQMVGANCYLQGRFLEIGMLTNGSFGAPAPPTGYHPFPSGSNLAETYDLGHHGWTSFNGDYTYPGSPFEGWEMQVNGARTQAFCPSSGYVGGGTLTGSVTAYTNVGGVITSYWTGSDAGGNLVMTQNTSIDTMASAVVVTTHFHNTGTTPILNVYYLRSCDPDNDEAHGGAVYFSTDNTIVYENDADHRVQVDALGTLYNDHFSLGTKDCRARAFIYSSWPISSTTDLSTIWSGTYGTKGVDVMDTAHGVLNGDVAIGLVYNLGTFAPGAQTTISYAYFFNDTTGVSGIDSAFPEPLLVVDSIPAAPSGPAPAPTYDSFFTCAHPGVINVPVTIANGATRAWTSSVWTWAPATGLSSTAGVTNTINTVALSGATTYTITGNDTTMGALSCNQRTMYLTVFPCFHATNNGPICMGDSLYLVGHGDSTGATYLWYGPAGFTSTMQSPNIYPTTMADSGMYYVIKIVGTSRDTVHTYVNIKPLPVTTLGTNAPICSQNTLMLTATAAFPGESYLWTGPNAFVSPLQNTSRINAPTKDAGMYKVVTDLNGCKDSAYISVEIDTTPALPTITSNGPICSHRDTLYFTSSDVTPGVSYSWTGPNGFTSLTQNPKIVADVSTLYTGVFSVTATYATCSNTNTLNVVVDKTPDRPVPVTNAPVCSGNTLTMGATSDAGSTYNWVGPNGFASGFQDPLITPVTMAATGIYSVTATIFYPGIAGGCVSDTITLNVIIDSMVTAGFTYQIHYGCVADTIAFTNNSTIATRFLWEFGDGTSSGDVNPAHVYTVQNYDTVVLSSSAGVCVATHREIINDVHPLSAAFTSDSSVICQGHTINFTDGSVSTGGSYLWSFGDGTTSLTASPSHTFTNAGVYDVFEVVTDFIPCRDTARETVYIDSLSPVYISLSDPALCQATYITVTGDYSGIGNTGIVWDFGNGDTVKNSNPVSYAYSTPGTYTITATALYRSCADATSTRTITIEPQPTINLGADQSICSGSDVITLADGTNGGTSGATWLWSTGQTTSSIVITAPGSYTATVTIDGCSASSSVNVTNDCYMNIPNVFTPNGDGLNDYFFPRQALTSGLTSFSISIYNRWGIKVFESTSLTGAGWDGKLGGVDQPEDVYIYIIDGTFKDGQKEHHQGNVTLLR